jgi:hypothetical protein
MKYFDRDTQLSEIPENAFNLEFPGNGIFAEPETDSNKVRLTLYDGSVVKHWYWGNLAFELAGIKLRKTPLPILFQHDVNQRIGFAQKTIINNKFTIEGEFLSSEIAQNIRRDAKDGFPFEASLKFDPARTNILKVADGEKIEVNGRTLKGPGTVMKSAEIMEGSICVFGALDETKTEIFNYDGKKSRFEPVTFEQAVEQQARVDNSNKSEICKKAAAIRFCVSRYPELYEQYREKLETS